MIDRDLININGTRACKCSLYIPPADSRIIEGLSHKIASPGSTRSNNGIAWRFSIRGETPRPSPVTRTGGESILKQPRIYGPLLSHQNTSIRLIERSSRPAGLGDSSGAPASMSRGSQGNRNNSIREFPTHPIGAGIIKCMPPSQTRGRGCGKNLQATAGFGRTSGRLRLPRRHSSSPLGRAKSIPPPATPESDPCAN